MPNMILIAYLNKNFTNCNENLAWGKQEPLFTPMCFGTSQNTEVGQHFILHPFHLVIIKF